MDAAPVEAHSPSPNYCSSALHRFLLESRERSARLRTKRLAQFESQYARRLQQQQHQWCSQSVPAASEPAVIEIEMFDSSEEEKEKEEKGEDKEKEREEEEEGASALAEPSGVSPEFFTPPTPGPSPHAPPRRSAGVTRRLFAPFAPAEPSPAQAEEEQKELDEFVQWEEERKELDEFAQWEEEQKELDEFVQWEEEQKELDEFVQWEEKRKGRRGACARQAGMGVIGQAYAQGAQDVRLMRMISREHSVEMCVLGKSPRKPLTPSSDSSRFIEWIASEVDLYEDLLLDSTPMSIAAKRSVVNALCETVIKRFSIDFVVDCLLQPH